MKLFKQRNLISYYMIFLITVPFVTNASEIHPEVSYRLSRQWGTKDESTLKKTVPFVPRLLSRPVSTIFRGQTADRVINFCKIPYSLGKGQCKEAYNRFTNSVANPLPLANDAISDVVTILKSPTYAGYRYTKRVQVCSTSLSNIYGIDPTFHIDIAIDGKDENQKDADYKNCQPVPIKSNEPESVVIDRLECVKRLYNPQPSIFNYNCGAITRDKLALSGLGFPVFPNLGIGNELGFRLSSNHRSLMNAMAELVKVTCDGDLNYFRTVFNNLEKGIPLVDHLQFKGKLMSKHSDDLILQLIISAARGKNEANRFLVKQVIASEPFSDPNIKKGYYVKRHIKKMFVQMDKEGLSWIARSFPSVAKLYDEIH